MKKSINKIVLILIAIVMLLQNTAVFAASVAPGGSFTVTLACGNIEGSVRFSAENATITGGTGDWCDRNKTFTISAKAGSQGNAFVSMIGVDATNVVDLSDYSGKTISSAVVSIVKPDNGSSNGSSSGSSGSGSGNTVNPPVTDNRSGNNNLSSITLSLGNLNPAFSNDITEYSIQLPAEADKINIQATASDAKASVAGTGEILLNAGDNKITITVTAENGNPKVYTINAYVDETPLIFTKYGEDELGVVRNLSAVTPLEGFEETTVLIEGNEVKAWHSPTRNITIIYLQKEDVKNYYIYDEAKGVTSIYKPIALLGNNLGIVDIPEELKDRNGMIYQEVMIDDTTLMGWVFENEAFKNYSLIYAMDEFGEYQYYQYESTQKSLQLYSGAAPIFQDDYNELIDKNETLTKVVYATLGGCVLLLILVLINFINASRYKKRLISKGRDLES